MSRKHLSGSLGSLSDAGRTSDNYWCVLYCGATILISGGTTASDCRSFRHYRAIRSCRDNGLKLKSLVDQCINLEEILGNIEIRLLVNHESLFTLRHVHKQMSPIALPSEDMSQGR